MDTSPRVEERRPHSGSTEEVAEGGTKAISVSFSVIVAGSSCDSDASSYVDRTTSEQLRDHQYLFHGFEYGPEAILLDGMEIRRRGSMSSFGSKRSDASSVWDIKPGDISLTRFDEGSRNFGVIPSDASWLVEFVTYLNTKK